MTPLLQVRGLSRRFGGLLALAPLDFDVPAGGLKAVIGPNGAGKSTLFNLLAGVTPPSSGTIVFGGARIEHLPTHRRATLGIGRTFQNLQVFRDMTALDNVMVGCHPMVAAGWWPTLFRAPSHLREERRMREAAMEALDRMGLCAEAGTPAGALSFGQCKLLELARALVARPRLLLLDEPAAGLPHAEVDRIIGLIRSLVADGATVLLVEHNMRLVMALADEILVLNHGQRIAEGDAAAVRSHPDVLAAYLGEDADA